MLRRVRTCVVQCKPTPSIISYTITIKTGDLKSLLKQKKLLNGTFSNPNVGGWRGRNRVIAGAIRQPSRRALTGPPQDAP